MNTWTRRWDPVVWQDREGAHMICLATDYASHNPGGLWWQDHNVLEYSRGARIEELSPVEEWGPPSGHIWTAPSVFRWHGKVYVLAGINRDGGLPDQRLWLFPLGEPHKSVGRVPEPLRHMTYKGAAAWRDGMVMPYDGRWLMTVTSGGFRWGGNPNIVLYEADDPLGRWDCLGPIMDPAISCLYAEMERPQLHHYLGRWLVWFSCWPSRHFTQADPSARQHVWASAGGIPVISRSVCNLSGAYGMIVRGGWCAGWRWINPDDGTGDVAVWLNPGLFAQIGAEMAGARMAA